MKPPYDEAVSQRRPRRAAGSFYEQDLAAAKDRARLRLPDHIIRVEEQVTENSVHGLLTHIAHPDLNPHDWDIDAYIQEIPPDSRTGKHRHMAEEFIFFLEGRGYTLFWDVELSGVDEVMEWKTDDVPKRYDWEATDWMFVPVNTVHQHFNLDGDEPARFLSATSRIFKWLGVHDLEQLEAAPTYRGY
jgi:mannose-6-phosphate isomerase-like protein (cupin superfamily)